MYMYCWKNYSNRRFCWWQFEKCLRTSCHYAALIWRMIECSKWINFYHKTKSINKLYSLYLLQTINVFFGIWYSSKFMFCIGVFYNLKTSRATCKWKLVKSVYKIGFEGHILFCLVFEQQVKESGEICSTCR